MADCVLCIQGEMSGEIHKVGIVESEEFVAEGSYVKARVPVPLAMRLAQFAVDQEQQQIMYKYAL